MSAAKWHNYYQNGVLPWDSGRPASQLLSYICDCSSPQPCSTTAHEDLLTRISVLAQSAPIVLPSEVDEASIDTHKPHVCSQCVHMKPPAGAAVLEVGCGTGASSIWLATCGYRVTAIDIVQEALDRAAAAVAAQGLPEERKPRFLQHDIFDLDSVGQRFDMIYDCQVYHALVDKRSDAEPKLARLLYNQLNPGGILFMLTGNANEPEIGPTVLTAEQLLIPLFSAGFELVLLNQSRFDSTDYYIHQLKKRPLAWWVVLQRPQG